MLLFGYPVEIWVATIIAVLIKLQSSKTLSVLGVITTIVVGVGAGVILYGPVITLFALSNTWEIIVAILIALSAENLMKSFVELSADKEFLSGWIKYLVNRKENDKGSK